MGGPTFFPKHHERSKWATLALEGNDLQSHRCWLLLLRLWCSVRYRAAFQLPTLEAIISRVDCESNVMQQLFASAMHPVCLSIPGCSHVCVCVRRLAFYVFVRSYGSSYIS